MLEIKDLHASVEGNEILKGISLSIKKGEIHAVMGPNGSGKSTLAKILSGHPSYEATGGEILFEGKNLFDMDAEERSLSGIFMGFHPSILQSMVAPSRSTRWPTSRSDASNPTLFLGSAAAGWASVARDPSGRSARPDSGTAAASMRGSATAVAS